MKKLLKWLILLALIGALAAGILRALKAREAKQQAAQEAAQAMQQEPTFELSARDVLTLARVKVSHQLALSGSIKAARTATLKADVAGSIVQWQVRAGDSVSAGQLLGRIEAHDLKARLAQTQQQTAALQATVAIQERQVQDSKRLAERGFISPSALQAAQDGLVAARANLAASEANVRLAQKALSDSEVRAPFAGQVAQSLVEAGDRVGVNTPMVQIVDLKALEWEAQVSAEQLREVQVGQSAQLRVPGIKETLAARVVRINPSLSAASRNATIYLSVQGQAQLRDGDFAQGLLLTGTDDVLAVPTSAVRHDKPEPYVQVIRDGKIVHAKVVEGRVGVVGEQAYVSIDGLEAGVQVLRVTAGAMAQGTQVALMAGAK